MRTTLHGPGLRVELDTDEIIPQDPGAGTPAMVYSGRYAGTYGCACDTGELDGGDLQLTARQVSWLHSVAAQVDDFLAQEG